MRLPVKGGCSDKPVRDRFDPSRDDADPWKMEESALRWARAIGHPFQIDTPGPKSSDRCRSQSPPASISRWLTVMASGSFPAADNRIGIDPVERPPARGLIDRRA